MSVMEAHLSGAQNNPFLAELNAQWSCDASWSSNTHLKQWNIQLQPFPQEIQK